MAEMGVACLKLEGRMKRPEYVATVTAVYRKALDEGTVTRGMEEALYTAFKRHGSTPNQTRQELLVRKAKQLLTTTDSSVQEISDQLGFSSTSYFRKILHRQTGKTPTQIRREVLSV